MLSFVVPPLARTIADRYKDVLEPVPFPLLCAYIASFVWNSGSFADFVRAAPWTSSLSTMSLGLKEFSDVYLNRAMKRLCWSVLKRIKKNQSEWIFVFDTTANPKRVAGLRGRGNWATSSGNVFDGRNLVVLTVVNTKTGHAIPVAWAPCIKSKDDAVNGKSAWELVLELLDSVVALNFPKLPIAGDSWFDGVPFLEELNKRGFTFNIELKSSRKAKSNISPNAKWESLATQLENSKKQAVEVGTKEIETITPGLRGKKFVAAKLLWIRQSKVDVNGNKPEMRVQVTAVYNHASDKKPFAFYATNDRSQSSVWQWQMARWRWNIEVLFRDLKQELAWGKLACESQEGNNAAIVIPFLIIAYIRLEINLDNDKSIGTILTKERQANTIQSIEFIMNNPKHGLLVKFKNRMNPERACLKPIDSVAETKFNCNTEKAA
jgi:hypothetical protein